MKKIKTDRAISPTAGLVIWLHEQGYSNDFELYGHSQLWGAQESRSYVLEEININKIFEIGGKDGQATKFILAIETADGCKGLLICIARATCFLNNKVE